MRSYSGYVAAVAAHGMAPITEEQWGQWQADLPAAKGVVMPMTLNHVIALALEAGDLYGAASLINQCEEHDQVCWAQYTTEGDAFPAGGLWFSMLEWMNGSRPEASPLTVAHMLDFDGELPCAESPGQQ